MVRLLFLGLGKSRHYSSATVPSWFAGETRDVEEGQAAYLLESFPEGFVKVDAERVPAAKKGRK